MGSRQLCDEKVSMGHMRGTPSNSGCFRSYMLTLLVANTWEDTVSIALLQKQRGLVAKAESKTGVMDSGKPNSLVCCQ